MQRQCQNLYYAQYHVFWIVVGYQGVEIPQGFSIFTATFKNVGADSAIDLNSIVPQTPAGVSITGDGKFFVLVLDDAGNYGAPVVWYGSKQGWSKDAGATLVADGEMVIVNGKGFAVSNTLKVKDGVESTARGSVASSALVQFSGEVDVVCANAVPAGFSVNGNSTPVAIDIVDIIPQTPAGATITGDGKLFVLKLDAEGNYSSPIVWYGTKQGWSADAGTTIIEKGAMTFDPGQGFAVSNTLKVKDGIESTARGSVASPAVLKLPTPVK